MIEKLINTAEAYKLSLQGLLQMGKIGLAEFIAKQIDNLNTSKMF